MDTPYHFQGCQLKKMLRSHRNKNPSEPFRPCDVARISLYLQRTFHCFAEGHVPEIESEVLAYCLRGKELAVGEINYNVALQLALLYQHADGYNFGTEFIKRMAPEPYFKEDEDPILGRKDREARKAMSDEQADALAQH